MKQYKHLFFDMDGTVTRSRSLIDPEMAEIFNNLSQDTAIISGAQLSQIQKQIGNTHVDYLMGQNGNHVVDGEKKEVWKNELTNEERSEIMAHIQHIENIRDWEVKDENDLIEDRGSQISYSLIGHNEDVSKKEATDPGGKKRTQLIEENPNPLKLVDVKIGGTTCLDYFKKNSNKATNILRLIKENGWKKEDCLYFGDALFPGGNDYVVVGVIDIQKVHDEHETLRILKEHYANS